MWKSIWLTAVLSVSFLMHTSVAAGETLEIDNTIIPIDPPAVMFIEEPEPEVIEPEEEIYEPIYTEYKSEDAEEYLWDELSKYSPSDVITAGVLGYFSRESELRSDAVTGWGSRTAYTGIDPCPGFTELIDAGLADGSSHDDFIELTHYKYGGYGLGQWWAFGYLEHFYEFASESGKSIGDASMQCEFVIASMQRNEELWEFLLEEDDPRIAGMYISVFYDGSEAGKDYIGYLADKFYEKYSEEVA